jgi:protein-S-isoprenylcysteine O-methyltransferase Ste14
MGAINLTEVVISLLLNTVLSLQVAYILWFVFLFVYWFADELEQRHNLKKSRKIKQINHHGLLIIFLLGSIILHYTSLYQEWPLCRFALDTNKLAGLKASGVLFMLSGLYFVIHARLVLDGHWGPHIYTYHEKEDNILIQNGIYKKVRHPVFLGQTLMTFGTFLLSNNMYIVFLPIFTLLLNRERATKEEEDLLIRFKDTFIEYRDKTPSFIPYRGDFKGDN